MSAAQANLGVRFARALASGAAAHDDAGIESILDAAHEQFLDIGLRRSSMENVAKRAGVSRITIYRRFPQKDRLVEAVMFRECRRVINQARELMRATPVIEDRIEACFVFCMRQIHSHPLLTRLLALEPELLLPFMTVKAGPVIAIGTAFIADQIRIAQREGAFPAYDPRPVAEILARLAHSILLTPHGGIPLMNDTQAKKFARDHILPLMRSDSH